jgi:hypothetical protein
MIFKSKQEDVTSSSFHKRRRFCLPHCNRIFVEDFRQYIDALRIRLVEILLDILYKRMNFLTEALEQGLK